MIARRPISEANYGANALRWGTAGLNIDACRVASTKPSKVGRTTGSKSLQVGQDQDGSEQPSPELGRYPSNVIVGDGFDHLSWAPFFYCAKPIGTERHDHPTAKPVKLTRYLARLATPLGGHVLDMFSGSASIGEGALGEGFSYVGIELDPAYAAVARARLQRRS